MESANRQATQNTNDGNENKEEQVAQVKSYNRISTALSRVASVCRLRTANVVGPTSQVTYN
jgi:hypothetical protein